MKAIAALAILFLSFSVPAQSACKQTCSNQHNECRNSSYQSCSRVANMAGCVRPCAAGDFACSMEQLSCTKSEQSKLKQCQLENDRAMSGCKVEKEQCETQCSNESAERSNARSNNPSRENSPNSNQDLSTPQKEHNNGGGSRIISGASGNAISCIKIKNGGRSGSSLSNTCPYRVVAVFCMEDSYETQSQFPCSRDGVNAKFSDKEYPDLLLWTELIDANYEYGMTSKLLPGLRSHWAACKAESTYMGRHIAAEFKDGKIQYSCK